MRKSFSENTREIRSSTACIVSASITNDAKGNYANPVTLGSGFFISNDGWLITCEHVVKSFVPGKQKLVAAVKLNESTVIFEEALNVSHRFPEIDMAAIKFNRLPDGMRPAKLSTAPPIQGENLGLIGYPASALYYSNDTLQYGALKPRVSKCVLASCEIGDFSWNNIKQKRLLETQFVFIKGNSGGPIFSEETGEIVGMVMGFQHIPQDTFEAALCVRDNDKSLTGEFFWKPYPALKPGFSLREITVTPLATYSYGVASDEIRKCLAPHISGI